mmetsp:Transcript_26177/g.53090  ORF Transcript_26177/g.53090 Transcript_26177/m.53090 type:complete len:556 (+) Transcript_26177:157-1824(+)
MKRKSPAKASVAITCAENTGPDVDENNDTISENANGDGITNTLENVDEISNRKRIKRSVPKYGSKEYWEARYKSHKMDHKILQKLNPADTTDSSDDATSKCTSQATGEISYSQQDTTYMVDGIELSNEAIRPGHDWYFTYEELKPLIIPLILGDMGEDAESAEEELVCVEEDSWAEAEDDEAVGDGRGPAEEVEHREELDGARDEAEIGHGEDEREEEAIETDDEQDEADEVEILIKKHTQQESRPKKVLEIGCGDVPLGLALADDLVSMETASGCNAKYVVEEITCIDYSEIVVRDLIVNQKKQEIITTDQYPADGRKGSEVRVKDVLQPSFEAIDARNLPYPSNSYDVILEKGTLDAMLSDPDEGIMNCVAIVKEMARVTAEGGAILIVSHLNANEAKGMSWLEDVVFRGLNEEWQDRRKARKEKVQTNLVKKPSEDVENGTKTGENDEKESIWSVEVHGGNGKIICADEDEGTDNNEDETAPTLGPAVYILKKRCVPLSLAKDVFSKLKRTGQNEKGNSENEEGIDGDDANGDGDYDAEMPPVKLEFLNYED